MKGLPPERWPDFARRWDGREHMDDPACDEGMLLRTLDQFRSLNRLVSRYRALLRRFVIRDMLRDPERPYHVVDLGAGGCDIPEWLLKETRRTGLSVHVTALDSDPRTVAHAARRTRGLAGLKVLLGDTTTLARLPPIDYIHANHVLHHIPDADIGPFLRAVDSAAQRGWVINDLKRSAWSYLGFQVLGRCYRHSFAFADGKRSIRRGFRREELQRVLSRNGLDHHTRVLEMVPGRIAIAALRTSQRLAYKGGNGHEERKEKAPP